jgi:hypothetical protein
MSILPPNRKLINNIMRQRGGMETAPYAIASSASRIAAVGASFLGIFTAI